MGFRFHRHIARRFCTNRPELLKYWKHALPWLDSVVHDIYRQQLNVIKLLCYEDYNTYSSSAATDSNYSLRMREDGATVWQSSTAETALNLNFRLLGKTQWPGWRSVVGERTNVKILCDTSLPPPPPILRLFHTVRRIVYLRLLLRYLACRHRQRHLISALGPRGWSGSSIYRMSRSS